MVEAIIHMYMEFEVGQSQFSKRDIATYHFIRLIVDCYGSNAGVGIFMGPGTTIIVTAVHLPDCVLAVMNERILD